MKTFIFSPEYISELLKYRDDVYLDKSKNEIVRIFRTVKPYYDFHTNEKMFTCEYLTGPEKLNWTQCYEKNLIKL